MTEVNIVSIDNNPASATAFFSAVASANLAVQCKTLINRIGAVKYVLDNTNTPNYIFVHCRFKEIPCHTLIRFIRQQEHLTEAKVFVIGDRITKRDLERFDALRIDGYVKSIEEITKCLYEI